jgi:hypothetical protein
VFPVLEAVARWQGVEPGESGEAAETYTIIRQLAMAFNLLQSPAKMSINDFMEWLSTASLRQLERFAADADWSPAVNYSEFRLTALEQRHSLAAFFDPAMGEPWGG